MGNEYDMTAERQSLKDKLTAIILLETSKDYKEMDSDLVTECVDFLMELEEKQKLTQEEIKQRVNTIPFIGKVTAIGSNAKKKIRAKRLIIIAAVLALLLALFGLFASSGDEALQAYMELGDALFDMPPGETVEFNGITIVGKPYKSRYYDSAEDLAAEEGIKILCPTWLPRGEKIVSAYHELNIYEECYVLICSDATYSVEIRFDSKLDDAAKQNSVEAEAGGFKFYYFVRDDHAQAELEYNGLVYSIGSYTEEELFKIIESLREIG
ncbi:MAG: hypothetical protein E7516_02865 [Ruminococcaceae bacterium]|nr:hypothetical protein [Oscillospiraceae bacterium]